MADLGLGELTDDQLVNLFVEATAEAVRRDPLVRRAMQEVLSTATAGMRLTRKLIRSAVRAVRQAEVQRLYEQVSTELRAEYEAGDLQLFPPGEEPKIVVMANLSAREQMVQEIRDSAERLKNGTASMSLSLGNGRVSLEVGANRFDGIPRVTDDAIRKVMQDLYTILH